MEKYQPKPNKPDTTGIDNPGSEMVKAFRNLGYRLQDPNLHPAERAKYFHAQETLLRFMNPTDQITAAIIPASGF